MKLKYLILATILALNSTQSHAQSSIGAIFGGLVGSAIGRNAAKPNTDPQAVEKALTVLASKLNENYPQKIDSDTKLDNVTTDFGKKFIYNYTLINIKSTDIDIYAFRVFLSELKTKVCSTSDLSIFFKNGVTLGYYYSGYDRKIISKYEIYPRDCGY